MPLSLFVSFKARYTQYQLQLSVENNGGHRATFCGTTMQWWNKYSFER